MKNSWMAICFSLLVAVMLTLLPMPLWTNWLRPAWVLMVLIYWTMTSPHKVNVGVAWSVGLIIDLLTDTLLGEHALAYTFVIYFVSRLHIRLSISPMLQQGISIFIFILTYQFIIFCIQGFEGNLPDSQLYWLSSLTSVLLWPWLFIIMRDGRRWFKVS